MSLLLLIFCIKTFFSQGSERAHEHVTKVMKTILGISENYFNEQQVKERVKKYSKNHFPRNVTSSMLMAMKLSLQFIMTSHGPKISLTEHQIAMWNIMFDRVFNALSRGVVQEDHDVGEFASGGWS